MELIFLRPRAKTAPNKPTSFQADPAKTRAEYEERNRAILAARQAGQTFKAIAQQHGITPARVRQIAHRQARRDG